MSVRQRRFALSCSYREALVWPRTHPIRLSSIRGTSAAKSAAPFSWVCLARAASYERST